MDNRELFLSCRRGDVQKVRYLVEQREVDVNERDKWDSTPLYYACLCGHKDVALYLLQKGAKCQANTFDGERCLYGALDDTIRNILRSYKVLTSYTMRRDAYGEFLRKLFDDRQYADVVFNVHSQNFSSHRCVLIARSTYFAKKFTSEWQQRDTIRITNKLVNPDAFRAMLIYIYTGCVDISVELLEDLNRLAKQCELHDLIDNLEAKMKDILSFESTKPGVHVTALSIDPDHCSLRRDFGFLAKHAIPPELCASIQQEMPFPEERKLVVPDVCIQIGSHYFLCHQAFMCGRCEYFRSLLDSWLDDQEWISFEGFRVRKLQLQEIHLDVFIHLLNYIYQDSCDVRSEEEAFEVLYTAEMLLLQGLKRQCAGYLERNLHLDNVVPCTRMSRMFKLPRLEDRCAEWMADNINAVVELSEFSQLIKDDAEEVKSREEADTIDIIDEVRFHITNFVESYSEIEEANEKLVLIDRLLETLGFDG